MPDRGWNMWQWRMEIQRSKYRFSDIERKSKPNNICTFGLMATTLDFQSSDMSSTLIRYLCGVEKKISRHPHKVENDGANPSSRNN